MRNNGRGGMQTSGLMPTLICPKCGKPAARLEDDGKQLSYMHFTKSGSVWHQINKPQEVIR